MNLPLNLLTRDPLSTCPSTIYMSIYKGSSFVSVFSSYLFHIDSCAIWDPADTCHENLVENLQLQKSKKFDEGAVALLQACEKVK